MTTSAGIIAAPPYVSVGCPYCGQAPGWACCNARMEVPGTRETTVPTHEERKKAYEHAGPPGVAKFVQIAFDGASESLLGLDAIGDVWERRHIGWFRVSMKRFEDVE